MTLLQMSRVEINGNEYYIRKKALSTSGKHKVVIHGFMANHWECDAVEEGDIEIFGLCDQMTCPRCIEHFSKLKAAMREMDAKPQHDTD